MDGMFFFFSNNHDDNKGGGRVSTAGLIFAFVLILALNIIFFIFSDTLKDMVTTAELPIFIYNAISIILKLLLVLGIIPIVLKISGIAFGRY